MEYRDQILQVVGPVRGRAGLGVSAMKWAVAVRFTAPLRSLHDFRRVDVKHVPGADASSRLGWSKLSLVPVGFKEHLEQFKRQGCLATFRRIEPEWASAK